MSVIQVAGTIAEVKKTNVGTVVRQGSDLFAKLIRIAADLTEAQAKSGVKSETSFHRTCEPDKIETIFSHKSVVDPAKQAAFLRGSVAPQIAKIGESVSKGYIQLGSEVVTFDEVGSFLQVFFGGKKEYEKYSSPPQCVDITPAHSESKKEELYKQANVGTHHVAESVSTERPKDEKQSDGRSQLDNLKSKLALLPPQVLDLLREGSAEGLEAGELGRRIREGFAYVQDLVADLKPFANNPNLRDYDLGQLIIELISKPPKPPSDPPNQAA